MSPGLPNAFFVSLLITVTKWMTFCTTRNVALSAWFFFRTFSGARMLYKNLPRAVGLRRITLHKTMNLKQEMVYFLLVECSHFMDHINEAANLLPILRARICGYTGIFRCVENFWSKPIYKYSKSCHEHHSLTRPRQLNECEILLKVDLYSIPIIGV